MSIIRFVGGPGGAELVSGELQRGFRLPEAKLVVFGEEQLLPARTAPKRQSLRTFVGGVEDLKVGEFVVHEDHGIGQFVGMKRLDMETGRPEEEVHPVGPQRSGRAAVEVMEILYGSGRALLMPLSRMHQIQRYSGVEGVNPRLDRLGGTSWVKKKTRIKRSLRKLATDLLKLYAQRKVAEAPSASEDTDLQRQFELAFEHVETEDQLRATAEVKEDLERSTPMDRLLCGDVGFGKTEVAMRAAFKMVDAGYQVIILAPTTILADQHLRTFRRRFDGFPVRVDMVSRFRSPAEVRKIREEASAGRLDILIGTHRLLGKDFEFPRLGLLIIDEEQRFGVAQKEKLTELRKNVHVLAMSATPVPRTLQLSLAGVRDLSTIETPPRGRLAVETRVVPFSRELIREAIEFELERGGQVFYVFNRVEGIEEVSAMLRELVPTARLGVGHGQLDEKELSRRMQAFHDREIDVLIATTIIENGIDIPSVNTLLVHHAERFGLAQLYQLRGRVGRGQSLGLCYLMVPSERSLPSDARKRLQAIQEFTELGSGFRIAARDLEIRGAGNLLGAEQSGHIGEVGLETYLKMLEETVRELQGETVEERVSTSVDLPIDLVIPEDYISEPNLRMELYRRVGSRDEDVSGLHEELRERFGPPPREISRLLEAAELQRMAEDMRIQAVVAKGRTLTIRLRRDSKVHLDALIQLVSERDGATFSPSGVLRIEDVAGEESLALARRTLEQIATLEAGEADAAALAN